MYDLWISGEMFHINLVGSGSGSSVNRFLQDPNTTCFKGRDRARVSFLDRNLDIRFNIEPGESGDWDDAAWCRTRALKALTEKMDEDMIYKIISVALDVGRLRGRNQIRKELNSLLEMERF